MPRTPSLGQFRIAAATLLLALPIHAHATRPGATPAPDEAATILATQLQQRLARQGSTAQELPGGQCWELLAQVPVTPVPRGATWHAGDISSDNPYLTPQERHCLTSIAATTASPPATKPAKTGYPGNLPPGAHAVQLKNGSWQICF